MYQRPQNHGYHAAKLAKNQSSKNLVCMQKTSFACGFTSIERRTIFDLWQVSYAALTTLRFAKTLFFSFPTEKHRNTCNVLLCIVSIYIIRVAKHMEPCVRKGK